MEITRTFQLFSLEHQLTMLVCAVIGAILVWGPKYFLRKETVDILSRSAGVLYLSYEIFNRVGNFIEGGRLVNALSLHLCSLSVLLCSIMLINRSKLIFDIVYYVGLIGGGMSLLTPNITTVFPMMSYIRYYFNHSFILVAIFFMVVNYDFRPSKLSILKSVAFCNVVMLIAGVVNAGYGTNFLYICEKPRGTTLMDILGPWPYYLFGLELMGVFLFALLYMPFLIYDLNALRTKKACETT